MHIYSAASPFLILWMKMLLFIFQKTAADNCIPAVFFTKDVYKRQVETIRPVKVRNEPVGCTATIVYEMYMENQIPVSKEIAGILCAAILSDTLMFRSPTCTEMDKMVACLLYTSRCV